MARLCVAAGGTAVRIFFADPPAIIARWCAPAVENMQRPRAIVAGAVGRRAPADRVCQEAAQLGEQGAVLLPHYLTEEERGRVGGAR